MPETVEEALDLTIQELRAGAQPWNIEDAAATRFRSDLEPSYRKNHDHWPKVRGKVLRLARCHGALAALIQEVVVGPPSSGSVEYWSLQIAGLLVQVACPNPPGGPGLLGKHCQFIPVSSLDATKFRKLYEVFVRVAPLEDWQGLLR